MITALHRDYNAEEHAQFVEGVAGSAGAVATGSLGATTGAGLAAGCCVEVDSVESDFGEVRVELRSVTWGDLRGVCFDAALRESFAASADGGGDVGVAEGVAGVAGDGGVATGVVICGAGVGAGAAAIVGALGWPAALPVVVVAAGGAGVL